MKKKYSSHKEKHDLSGMITTILILSVIKKIIRRIIVDSADANKLLANMFSF